MTISFEKLTLEISREEAYTLYSTIKHGIEDRISDHWKNHGTEAYEKMEVSRLHMMRELARFTGNDFDYDAQQLKQHLFVLQSNQP